MDRREAVIAIAGELGLLDASDSLKTLDSMNTIDFVVRLEEMLDVMIPTTAITPQVFESVDALVRMLEELDKKA